MLRMQSLASDTMMPDWLWRYLGIAAPVEGTAWSMTGHDFIMRDGIPRATATMTEAQAQTEQTFGFKWHQRETFESKESLARMREWLVSRYGDLETAPCAV